jgi:hypothetical protein
MPTLAPTSTLWPQEASAIVEGYCTYEGIDSTRYDATCKEPRFEWKIYAVGRGEHNTAFLTQASKEGKVGCYNDSLAACYLRPEETKAEGVNETHYFRQESDSNDCGFCAAYFVIHAINYFEKASKKDASPSLVTLPAPSAKNPFSPNTRIITRMQSAFYSNCQALRIQHEIKKLKEEPTPHSAEIKEELRVRCIVGPHAAVTVNSKGWEIFNDFFHQKKREQNTRLAPEAFMNFVLAYLPRARNGSALYDDWFLYQNLMLYLLLNHFQETCDTIQHRPETLSLSNVLTHAKRVNAESRFYEKQSYQAFAKEMLPNYKPAAEIKVPSAPAKQAVQLERKTAFKDSIDQKTFQDIICQYETKSKWGKLVSCFFSGDSVTYRSVAIRKLRELKDHKEITREQVAKALAEDSKQRCQRFFGGGATEKPTTSTDVVIDKLQDAFLVKKP